MTGNIAAAFAVVAVVFPLQAAVLRPEAAAEGQASAQLAVAAAGLQGPLPLHGPRVHFD